MSPSAAPSRRALLRATAAGLAVGGLGALTACTPGPGSWSDLRVQPLDGDPPPPEPAPDADELARRGAVAAAQELRRAAQGASAPADRPDLAALLAALAGVQDAQLAQLEPAGGAATPPSPAPAPAIALDALPTSLTGAAATARQDLAAVTGGMARLLACLAAGDDTAAAALSTALGQPVPEPPPWTGPGGSGPVTDAAAAALTTVLDGERAAVYAYGVAAARVTGPLRDRALEHLGAHSRGAEALAARLADAQRDVPPGAAAWALPLPVTDASTAVALAIAVEDATAAGAADLVAAAEPADREAASALLAERARRAAGWRAQAGRAGELVALPGLTGR